MNIKAKVERLGFIGNNRGGINILFYGTLSNNKEFELEIPYTKEGLIVEGKCNTIKRDLGEYFTPQDFIDMGKIYEKVQKLESKKIIDLIQKTTDIKRKYSKLINNLSNENYNLEKEMNKCDDTIKEYQKKLNRLKREDKREELQEVINNISKDKDNLFHQWDKNEVEIGNLETLQMEEISSLEVI